MMNGIINELKRRAQSEGNGFIITMRRTGKKYEVYFQENGKYHITDKYNQWVPEKYSRTFNTIEELAEEILNIA